MKKDYYEEVHLQIDLQDPGLCNKYVNKLPKEHVEGLKEMLIGNHRKKTFPKLHSSEK